MCWNVEITTPSFHPVVWHTYKPHINLKIWRAIIGLKMLQLLWMTWQQRMWIFTLWLKLFFHWRLPDLHVFHDVLNLRWFRNWTFIHYWPVVVDSSFLFLFRRLCVSVWQSIITENIILLEYFANAHNFSTTVINEGSCPKYYFQSDEWLLNREDKTSLNIFLEEKKKQKQLLPAFNLHSWIPEAVQNTTGSAESCQVGDLSLDSLTSRPTQVARHPGAFFILLVICLVSVTVNDSVWEWSRAAAAGERFDWPGLRGFCASIIQNCKLTLFSFSVILQKWKLTRDLMRGQRWSSMVPHSARVHREGLSTQPTRSARSSSSLRFIARPKSDRTKEALCADANQWRDRGLRRVDQRGEVEDRKVKRSHCQKRRAKTNWEERGERGRMDRKIQIKTRAALFSVICRPVCGFWIHSMASLAPARSGTPLMMFCNQVL